MAIVQACGSYLLIVLIFTASITFASDGIPDELKQKAAPYQEEIRQLVDKAMQKQKEILPEVKEFYEKNNPEKLATEDKTGIAGVTGIQKLKLSTTERLYIFMSSSVPLTVWQTYAKAIEDYGFTDRAVMILRGCIGGCKYIKPTLKFIKEVLQADTTSPIKAQIWIDPLLFRMYDIKRVPCFVYATGIELLQTEVSEGNQFNLKTKPQYRISCGDWAFDYHLEKLGLLTGR